MPGRVGHSIGLRVYEPPSGADGGCEWSWSQAWLSQSCLALTEWVVARRRLLTQSLSARLIVIFDQVFSQLPPGLELFVGPTVVRRNITIAML